MIAMIKYQYNSKRDKCIDNCNDLVQNKIIVLTIFYHYCNYSEFINLVSYRLTALYERLRFLRWVCTKAIFVLLSSLLAFPFPQQPSIMSIDSRLWTFHQIAKLQYIKANNPKYSPKTKIYKTRIWVKNLTSISCQNYSPKDQGIYRPLIKTIID